MRPAGVEPTDPAQDVLRYEHQPLDAIFRPQTIAVIGATEQPGSVGRTVMHNLLNSPFAGRVVPVNLKRPSVLGVDAYPSIRDVPAKIDLAVIATPAPTVPAIIHDCVDAGVRGAIVLSAGFKEVGAAGADLERQIVVEARRGGMRVIGPNCLGVMNPLIGLNATFASAMARPGNVAFISQSGALCTAILDWSLREMVGFSSFVSIGSMADVGWGDLINHLGDDPHTHSIVIYMETIGDARAFISAAREVAFTKPIIVIKAGRTEAAARAAASHTGSLAGSDEVLDAAFQRSGVIRVSTIADLFYMAEVLSKQPRPRGPRLAILTNAGGPGVLATDALILNGGELASLDETTIDRLNAFLPPHWSRTNPVDILGDAAPERYAEALNITSQDENTDGLLVILTPQGMTEPTQTAQQLTTLGKTAGKPVLASWMGGADIAAGEEILNRANIPTFPYPDTAARIFTLMWRYSQNLRSLYETPIWIEETEGDATTRAQAEAMISAARDAGRTLLTEAEAKRLLHLYGIPTVRTEVATSADDAVARALDIGFPVVVKLHSETITHKTDVQGVHLNLGTVEAVREAYQATASAVPPEHFQGVTVQPMIKLQGYELIIGSSFDQQFGPVLLFGSGGQLVEVMRDRALALPPLTTTLARRMMEKTRIFRALQGVRGRPPIDIAALEQLLVRFSHLVLEQPMVREIDINPLLAAADGLTALDARIILHDPSVPLDRLPRPAIRPYPSRYASQWTLSDGTPVLLRPIRPEDEPLMVEFHKTLSLQSVYSRYFHLMSLPQRIAHERLTRICFIDYDREMALVAVERDRETGTSRIMGVGRLSKIPGTDRAEFAVLVSDLYQGRGLGRELLRRLVEIGRAEGVAHIEAEILVDNVGMQRISEELGFKLHYSPGSDVVQATLDL